MGEMKSCRQRAYQSSVWLVHPKPLLKAGACPNPRGQQGVCYPSASWVIPAASGSHELCSDARLPRAAGTEAAAPQRWGLHKHLPEFGGMGISEPISPSLKRRLFGGYLLCPLTEFLHPAPGEPLFSYCMETTPGCRVVSVATRGFRAPRTGVQIPILALPHLVTWNNSVYPWWLIFTICLIKPESAAKI